MILVKKGLKQNFINASASNKAEGGLSMNTQILLSEKGKI
jgi:hypothetical protein